MEAEIGRIGKLLDQGCEEVMSQIETKKAGEVDPPAPCV